MTALPTLTILSDNRPGLPGLGSVWGFSALIRIAGRTILFDTGSNGRILVANMAALGIAAESVDLAFFSHIHWDHVGGMDSFLELDPAATVVVHEGFSKHLIADLRHQAAEVVVVGAEPRPLAPGILSTGMLDSTPPEQALVLDSGDVAAVVSGCAHPGIERIVERAGNLAGRPIDWVIGGFHLMYSDAAEIERTIHALQSLGVAHVVPTHCTGDQATAAFRRAYGDRFVEGGVGREIRLAPRHDQPLRSQ
ncbi:MAG: MBL fold metallo-hydrolase [Candidatus Nanopelagicales bacterium]